MQGEELRAKGQVDAALPEQGAGESGGGGPAREGDGSTAASAQPARRDARNMRIYRLLNSPRSRTISSQPR